MLSEACFNVKNFFSAASDKYFDSFTISDSQITPPVPIQDGQYFRIVGSVFNDGVHQFGDVLQNETFEGAIWLMRVPKDFLDLCGEMEAWQDKYGSGESLSPYQSESFGGYTYTKASGTNGGNATVWDVFKSRLDLYRKARI